MPDRKAAEGEERSPGSGEFLGRLGGEARLRSSVTGVDFAGVDFTGQVPATVIPNGGGLLATLDWLRGRPGDHRGHRVRSGELGRYKAGVG
jgi:hypothetical protein